jgi:hypothetical protein
MSLRVFASVIFRGMVAKDLVLSFWPQLRTEANALIIDVKAEVMNKLAGQKFWLTSIFCKILISYSIY